MARGRGGRRTPANPAPVSGPGALSRRTDGGASQPVRSFPAEFQGQRQALSNLQSAAPLAAGGGGGSSVSGSPSGAPSPLPANLANGILGPTQRPTEPVTAGLGEPQVIPRDPDMLIREMYRRYPHPDIGRLLQ